MFFLFFIIIVLILLFSKIKIEIENLRFSSIKNRHINKDYKSIIKLCIFGRIPIIKINITKAKIEKLKMEEKIKQVDWKFIEKNQKFNQKVWKAIKNSNIKMKSINLKIKLGTENASLTSIIVPIISTIIAITIKNQVENYQKQSFIVEPIYINQNLINIAFTGIFEIKMIHIINIIYILTKKKGVDKNERTSNRRAYDYSYE